MVSFSAMLILYLVLAILIVSDDGEVWKPSGNHVHPPEPGR